MIIRLSRFEIAQITVLIIILFITLIFQDSLRPYHHDSIDNLEVMQLVMAHFILLAGLVYAGAQRTLEVSIPCDISNGTTPDVTCNTMA